MENQITSRFQKVQTHRFFSFSSAILLATLCCSPLAAFVATIPLIPDRKPIWPRSRLDLDMLKHLKTSPQDKERDTMLCPRATTCCLGVCLLGTAGQEVPFKVWFWTRGILYARDRIYILYVSTHYQCLRLGSQCSLISPRAGSQSLTEKQRKNENSRHFWPKAGTLSLTWR